MKISLVRTLASLVVSLLAEAGLSLALPPGDPAPACRELATPVGATHPGPCPSCTAPAIFN